MERLTYVTHRNGVFVKFSASSEFAREVLRERYREGDSLYFTVKITDNGDSVITECFRNGQGMQIGDIDLEYIDYVLKYAEKEGFR